MPIRTPRREVPAPLRGLTLGVEHSRGPISVSPLIGADSRCRFFVSTAALSVEGLRTAVSPDPLPGPVLRCGVPPAGSTVASLAQRTEVPVQRRGEAMPARAVASLPGTLSTTPSSPLGANAARHRSSGSGGSRGGAAGYGHAARGPAHSSQSGRFFWPALPTAWLLCAHTDSTGCSTAAFLFMPMPSGIASCP